MDVEQAIKDTEFSKEDEKRIVSLLPFMKEHLDGILDESIFVLAKDQRVVELLKKNNLKPETAKLVWKNLFELVFSKPTSDETIERLKQVGTTHTKAGVSEDFAITAIALFMAKTLEHLKTNMNTMNFSMDYFISVAKFFLLIGLLVVVSYVEERKRGIMNSLGVSDALLDRLAKLGIQPDV